jgi:hypothetical protein
MMCCGQVLPLGTPAGFANRLTRQGQPTSTIRFIDPRYTQAVDDTIRLWMICVRIEQQIGMRGEQVRRDFLSLDLSPSGPQDCPQGHSI